MNTQSNATAGGRGPSRSASVLLIHNVSVVQSRAGWTAADVERAMADAREGIRYVRDSDERDYLTYFVVTVNMPGYLPEGEPYAARGAHDAMQALVDELERSAEHLEASDDGAAETTVGELRDAIAGLQRAGCVESGGTTYYIGELVYEATPRTRAELEADGWTFTPDGEVAHDAMPY